MQTGGLAMRPPGLSHLRQLAGRRWLTIFLFQLICGRRLQIMRKVLLFMRVWCLRRCHTYDCASTDRRGPRTTERFLFEGSFMDFNEHKSNFWFWRRIGWSC